LRNNINTIFYKGSGLLRFQQHENMGNTHDRWGNDERTYHIAGERIPATAIHWDLRK
jgi:hypothetical protein